MKPAELLILAIGLSADAFAVATCTGLNMPKVTIKKSAVIGLYFGVFQAVMPLIGFSAAALFAVEIAAYDHWIAFALLCFLGGKMAGGSFAKKDYCCCETSLSPGNMLPLALAVSIDALAVGVSLAFLRVSIVPAVSFIGAVTFVLSVSGVKIGNLFGVKLKSKAELAGGVILMLIGLKILLEHTGIIRL